MFNSPGNEEQPDDGSNDSDNGKTTIVDDSTSNDSTADNSSGNSLVAQLDADGNPIIDSVKGALYIDTITGIDTFLAVTQTADSLNAAQKIEDKIIEVDEEVVRIENDLLILDITNHGGRIKHTKPGSPKKMIRFSFLMSNQLMVSIFSSMRKEGILPNTDSNLLKIQSHLVKSG